MAWPDVVLVVYLSVLALLSLNGLHRLWMLRAYRAHEAYGDLPAPPDWPVVTVQLPLFNEKHVVERLGGSIEAESEVSIGSTFTVFLPLSPPENAGT